MNEHQRTLFRSCLPATKRATAHAPRSQLTSTRPLPKSWTPNRPVSHCPQTVNTVHSSSLWTKGAELKHDVIRLRSLVDVQSKSPYCFSSYFSLLVKVHSPLTTCTSYMFVSLRKWQKWTWIERMFKDSVWQAEMDLIQVHVLYLSILADLVEEISVH